jgi:hypothetical protein
VIIVTSATLREKNKSNGKIITMYLLNKSKAVFFLLFFIDNIIYKIIVSLIQIIL